MKKFINIALSCLIMSVMGCSEEEKEEFDPNYILPHFQVLDDADTNIQFSNQSQAFEIQPNIKAQEFGCYQLFGIYKYSQYNYCEISYKDFMSISWGMDLRATHAMYDTLIRFGILPQGLQQEIDQANEELGIGYERPEVPDSYQPIDIKYKWLHLEMDEHQVMRLSINQDSIYEPKHLYIVVSPFIYYTFSNWEIEVTAPEK